jgi:transposase
VVLREYIEHYNTHARTDHSISTRPQAALRRTPARPSDHCDETAWCADAQIPELATLAETIETWWPAIEVFLATGLTNARTEGTNRFDQAGETRRLRVPQSRELPAFRS